jgi:hypothetical protein
MRSKELSVELQDRRIVLRQKISAALKVPKNTMEEVWKHQDSSYSWLPGQTKQSGDTGLGQGGDQEPDGHSDRAPEFHCGEG